MLLERAVTTGGHLAEAPGQPKGSVGHHPKVLEETGPIRVVRTRKARVLTEKYYGRIARLFEILTLWHARVPAEKVREFSGRVMELADEFACMEAVSGKRVYVFVAGVNPTGLSDLPEEE